MTLTKEIPSDTSETHEILWVCDQSDDPESSQFHPEFAPTHFKHSLYLTCTSDLHRLFSGDQLTKMADAFHKFGVSKTFPEFNRQASSQRTIQNFSRFLSVTSPVFVLIEINHPLLLSITSTCSMAHTCCGIIHRTSRQTILGRSHKSAIKLAHFHLVESTNKAAYNTLFALCEPKNHIFEVTTPIADNMFNALAKIVLSPPDLQKPLASLD